MVRTIISFEEEDKAWLDRQAEAEQVSMAELVRRAVRRLRQESAPGSRSFEQHLQETSGLWRGGDALDVQLAMRREWDNR